MNTGKGLFYEVGMRGGQQGDLRDIYLKQELKKAYAVLKINWH